MQVQEIGFINKDGKVETDDGRLFLLPVRGTTENGYSEVLIDAKAVGGGGVVARQSIEPYIGMKCLFARNTEKYGFNFAIIKENIMEKTKHLINREYTMSIDIDSQKGFTPVCQNELPVEGGDLIVDELNKNAEFAKLRVGSKDLHPANAVWIATDEMPVFSPVEGHGENVDIHWPAHCLSGTVGAELLDGLPAPEEYNFFVWKGMEPNLHPYGIFYHDLGNILSTGLIEYLMANIEIDTFIIGGLALDYCVYESVRQLKMFLDMCEEYDCRIIVNLEATAGVAPDTTAKAIEDLEKMGVIFINGADELELI